jgi:hypothetical protein
MSYLAQKEVACPACKHPFEADLWSVMNVREDAELKDLLLGGEINMTACPACQEVFHVDAFLLYHDPDNEILAFVYPLDQKQLGELLTEKTMADFVRDQENEPAEKRLAYKPVFFFGLNDLAAFVEKDEEVALQSEVAQAIAEQERWPVRKVRPSLARAQDLPRILPVTDDTNGASRDAVIGGLRRLVETNDRLTVYVDALRRLAADPASAVRLS